MNGDLMTTIVQVGNNEGTLINAGLFYSIVDKTNLGQAGE